MKSGQNSKILQERVGIDLTIGGDGWGWIRISAGMGEDGCEVCKDGWGRD